MKRFYVGHKHSTMTVFKHDAEPTEESHGNLFNAVVGPFKTKRGAEFFRDHSSGNPHIICVADAERIAKKQVDHKWELENSIHQ